MRCSALSALFVTVLSLGMVAGAGGADTPSRAGRPRTLRLATTTSTDDSGLLKAILPDFEKRYRAGVEVVAVGTGQALRLAASGDVDVVLVHARQKEDQFVADGHGINRRDVMYNDFILVGPRSDAGGASGAATAKDAFAKIAARRAPFVSRGDDSGTHAREREIWASAGIAPSVGAGWYLSIGQGMGETLLFANEKAAYTLTDRGTWLARRSGLPDLTVMVGGASVSENRDSQLLNPYGVIPVNPAMRPGVRFDLAARFAEWITSAEVQRRIADFGKEEFGQPLFYPNSAAWKATHPGNAK
ncbi:MAG: tungstate ABC transporter [Candidatus Handelsmanbacteria bacterium RIFCSPLOWO2_12_FULL_64_10]|uniref:Tungstate ABC transporter n=1 Tax=Handelsmanbacteria sp. (strain RIFCSPLOWO2_12_FULL_64_10) TaxID=1817868 RepID=A0A1F6CSH8_HANXR|nr:MAG: tungstate ABC transporter [Candidatus Handelsmanbacteria bacterium RIFCSPLOWO2_12_FULL_64_10]